VPCALIIIVITATTATTIVAAANAATRPIVFKAQANSAPSCPVSSVGDSFTAFPKYWKRIEHRAV